MQCTYSTLQQCEIREEGGAERHEKKVYLWTGEGDNGKSITQTFFEKMLGELAIKFNTQYFTGKKPRSEFSFCMYNVDSFMPLIFWQEHQAMSCFGCKWKL